MYVVLWSVLHGDTIDKVSPNIQLMILYPRRERIYFYVKLYLVNTTYKLQSWR